MYHVVYYSRICGFYIPLIWIITQEVRYHKIHLNYEI